MKKNAEHKNYARAGYRIATLELELPKWNEMQQRDMLIGTSFTG